MKYVVCTIYFNQLDRFDLKRLNQSDRWKEHCWCNFDEDDVKVLVCKDLCSIRDHGEVCDDPLFA